MAVTLGLNSIDLKFLFYFKISRQPRNFVINIDSECDGLSYTQTVWKSMDKSVCRQDIQNTYPQFLYSTKCKKPGDPHNWIGTHRLLLFVINRFYCSFSKSTTIVQKTVLPMKIIAQLCPLYIYPTSGVVYKFSGLSLNIGTDRVVKQAFKMLLGHI